MKGAKQAKKKPEGSDCIYTARGVERKFSWERIKISFFGILPASVSAFRVLRETLDSSRAQYNTQAHVCQKDEGPKQEHAG